MPKQYTQHFRKQWTTLPAFKNWLAPHADENKAFCKYCQTVLNARLADLKKHSETSKHKKGCSVRNGQRTVQFQRTKFEDEKARTQLKLATHIAVHSAIRTCDHMVSLCNTSFTDSKSSGFKFSRTKCTSVIVNILEPYFRKCLKEDIDISPYSLILDESTDISVQKLLGVVVKYFSLNHNRICSTFLGLVQLEGGTADHIVDGVQRLLQYFELNTNNLSGIGTDNASVMTGINNGVHVKLKTELNIPNLILFRCVCHSLQLAVSDACKTLPTSVEFLVRETHNWFSHSSIRRLKYEHIFKILNPQSNQAPKIVPGVSNTRWMSIAKAVSVIIDQWETLKEHFESTHKEENCYAAGQLHSMYCDKKLKTFLQFLHPILDQVKQVNSYFESETNDPSKLLDSLIHLTKSIGNKILLPGRQNTFNYFTDCIANFLDPKPYLGYTFETALKENQITVAQEIELRQRCKNFLIALFNELQSRFPSNIEILQNINLMSVNNVLRHNKLSIIPLLDAYETNKINIQKIEQQWNDIHLIKWQNITNTTEFWKEVHSYKDCANNNPFKELSFFALKMLTLPYSNADVERVFSVMNAVKTKLRNRLHLRTLNAILEIKYGLKLTQKCCYDYEFPDELCKNVETSEKYVFGNYPLAITLKVNETDNTNEIEELIDLFYENE